MAKIVLDAGHGINTPGKRSPADEREWSFNDAVLRACAAHLRTYIGVSILRVDDASGRTDVPLQTRVNRANAWGADIYVSIHHNANTARWGSWGGVETFVYPTASKASVALANAVQPRIVSAMGLRDRGVKRANLHVLRATNMPAILTEGGFMDSTTDIVAMRDSARMKAQGIAIAEGIAAHLGLRSGGNVVASVSKPAKPKEDDELKFSSGTLKAELAFSLASKAHRQLIIDAALAQGYNGVHAERLKDGTIEDGDLLALAAGAIVRAAKK